MKKYDLKTKEQIAIMAEGGHILGNILKELGNASQVGVSTKSIEILADKLCKEYAVTAATKGYKGFPASYCSCVNDVVVHGIPSSHEILKDGDVFTIDMVLKYKGLHTDAAITVPIGNVSKENLDFLATVKKARDEAIAKVKPGRRIGDLSAIMEYTVRLKGYSPVRELIGHGIGRTMHEEPEIPCYGLPGTGPVIEEGMTLAIEAIIAKGKPDVTFSREDGWTVRTKDGNIAAVFEHTVAVTKNGCMILTV